MTKRSASPPQALAPIRPAWIYKTSPNGRHYRICTIPLALLPRLLQSEMLEPKTFFFYPPEASEVLGVRSRDDERETEL